MFGGMWFVWLAPFKVNTIILSIAPGLADRRLFQFQSLFWGGIELQHHLRRRPGGCNNRVATHDSLTSTTFPPTVAESSDSGGGLSRETQCSCSCHVGALIMGEEES